MLQIRLKLCSTVQMQQDSAARQMLPSISDVLRCSTAADVAKTLDTYGAAIIMSDIGHEFLTDFGIFLSSIPIEQLQAREPYDGKRFSFNNWDLSESVHYMTFKASPLLNQCLSEIFGQSWLGQGGSYRFHMCGGDKVMARTDSWQDLHSDWESYPTCSMKWGYALAVSIACHDVPTDMSPIRLMPWNEMKRMPYEDHRQGYLVDLIKGEFLIRDVRAAHSGSPNLTDRDRCLPGCQLLSPEYLEHLHNTRPQVLGLAI